MPTAVLVSALTSLLAVPVMAPGALLASPAAAVSAYNAVPTVGQARNHVLGARLTQSSTYGDATVERSQDGNTEGNFFALSVSHTGADVNPWWQADFGSARSLNQVVIWNRTDAEASRLQNALVFASATPFTSTDPSVTRAQAGVQTYEIGSVASQRIEIAVTGSVRYLRIQKASGAPTYLHLAEVGAYGSEVLPAPATQQWVSENPFGMFVHYGPGTYTNSQWNNPNNPSTVFAPTADVNPRQWAQTMKAAGMTYGVFTAKHHDGFSLYNTRYSSYDIASSGYEGGNADLVREYVDAMRAEGLKVGLYFSIWDRKNGNPEWLIKAQLRELLTGYGTIDYLWFDGWWPGGDAVTYEQIAYRPVRDWLHNVSPQTVLANNDHQGNPASTDAIVYEVPIEGYPTVGDMRPKETADTLDSYNSWFFNEPGTGPPRSVQSVVGAVRRMNQQNSAYLLNVGPDRSGAIPASYVQRLAEVGNVLRQPIGPNYLTSPGVTVGQSSTAYGGDARRAVDRDTSGNFSSTTVTHTADEASPWWGADLGQVRAVSSLRVWNRDDPGFADRLNGALVFTSSAPFASSDAAVTRGTAGVRTFQITSVPSQEITVPISGSFRYLRIQLPAASGRPEQYVSLAEVQAVP